MNSGPILDASSGFQPARRTDAKLFSAPASRNTEHIISLLRQLLPSDTPGMALAIAEGSGQHVTSFASAFPNFVFLPTDVNAASMESIQAYSR